MIFTFLGTGTSQGVPIIGCSCEVCQSTNPQDKRLRVSGLLKIGEKTIVIDCGPDFRQQMLREKVIDVDAILITHEHNDHIIGLDDVRPLNFLHQKDMPVYADERVQKELKERFAYIFVENKYPGAPMVALKTIKAGEEFEIEGIKISPIEVMHGNLPILGFRIEDFAYLTDVKTISEAEIEKLQDLDVVVLSALHHTEHHSHSTLAQATELATRINAKRTYFIHFSHHLGLHKEIEKILPPTMFLAYDGLSIHV